MSASETVLDKQYWDHRYLSGEYGWDLGDISPPLQTFFDGLKNKGLKILIPGAGNAYEAEYLHRAGFRSVYIVDLAPHALDNFRQRCPDFPTEHLREGDFFELRENNFDLIIEQTFFCALEPILRSTYFDKMIELLKPGGSLVGLLFDDALNSDRPPFGGSYEEYHKLIEGRFEVLKLESCYNSIAPRAGRELFMHLRKPPM